MSQICYQFKDTGSCKFGDSCRFSHSADSTGANNADGTFETVRRNTSSRGRGTSNRGGSTSARPYTTGRPAQMCNQWQDSGECSFGDRCRFSHGEEYTQTTSSTRVAPGNRDSGRSQQCYQYAETGTCQYGDRCRFQHGSEAPRNRSTNKSNGVCYQYKETGSCKYGDSCRFSHSDESSVENKVDDTTETVKSPIAASAS